MSELCYVIFGKPHGDFHPAHQTKEQLLSKIKNLIEEHLPRISAIYSPKIGFTTNIACFGENNEIWSPYFLRSREYADGGVVSMRKIAIGVFNGDCPLLCLWENDKLAVLHVGYRCLIRANPKEENIIESAMRQFNPNRVRAFIFGGIGPCCWVPEYDDKPEILNPDLSRHSFILQSCLNKTSSASPFGPGYVSVNLYKLSYELLKASGVPDSQIKWNHECSCCAKDRSKPAYWSHTRYRAQKQDIDGRNLALAWLE